MMSRRTFPGTDLSVSVVGIGCNNFGGRIDAAATEAVVDAAIDQGVTLFDTAESYGNGESETLLGRPLKGRRDQVVIATKFGWWNDPDNTGAKGDPKYVRSAIEASLTRLGTDYVDLYQYHRPDRVTPIEETLGAMHELVVEGKVRFIGSSNMTGAEILSADQAARTADQTRLISAQNEYSWLKREAEVDVIPACAEAGIGLIPFFPLASGLLTGKYTRGEPAPDGTRLAKMPDMLEETTDEDWDRLERLEEFAKENGVSLLEVAIGGLASMPAVTSVIAGATKPEQVAANVAAGSWVPSADQLQTLIRITGGTHA
jgi:aryl-alcohol dehydrogenase-like predicted oxidoreductase